MKDNLIERVKSNIPAYSSGPNYNLKRFLIEDLNRNVKGNRQNKPRKNKKG